MKLGLELALGWKSVVFRIELGLGKDCYWDQVQGCNSNSGAGLSRARLRVGGIVG